MIQSNLLSLKSGTDLLGISGSLQKGNIEKRRFQLGLMEGPMAFLNVLKGNMSFIGKHNGKAFEEGIVSLQKGLCSEEGCKDGGAGIHRSDREVIANFLKGCGFNEREIEKIVYAIRDDSGPSNVKIKEPTVIGGKGVIKGLSNMGGEKEGESSPAVSGDLRAKGVISTESPRLVLLKNGSSLERETASGKLSGTEINKKGATSPISAKSQGEKNNFRCTPVAVGHNENGAEIERSLREVGTKELSDRRAETFHKGIRPLVNLINESFSGGKPQHNISHVSNVSVEVNEGDIKPQILIKQIVESAGGKLSHGVGRVKIALHPPHLGTLHMDIVLNNNKVQVILQVENDKVRHVLQLNVEQLKNSLHSQGLIVDSVNVLLQEKSGNTNYGFGQNGYLFKEGRNRGENGEDQRGEQDFLSHNSSILEEKESGLQTDGRISVFA